MQWIALRWPPEPEPSAAGGAAPDAEALGWWALQFTPRACWQDETLLLEISACERLWGGRRRLMAEISQRNLASAQVRLGQGATSLIAMARVRLWARGERPPADVPAGLPLDVLTAAQEHLDMLARMGCRTWGDVAALPRGGVARRFGTGLRQALDVAWGLVPETHRWLTLPDVFDQKIELPALAGNAPELMWSAARLLGALQIWLRVRQRGVLAVELQWTLDLRRVDGIDLPPTEQLEVRTSEPTQDVGHLKRLLGERLSRLPMAAPASWLRLRTLGTAPWHGASTSFLPEDNRKGDRLHELVERLSERLGTDRVLTPVARADHRPEAMQQWQAAQGTLKPLQATLAQAKAASAGQAPRRARAAPEPQGIQSDALYPPWLLPQPLPLDMQGGRPCYHGALRTLAGPQRLEAGWWATHHAEGGEPVVRDYYIAESPQAGRVWIFCEKGAPSAAHPEGRHWYLHGLYA